MTEKEEKQLESIRKRKTQLQRQEQAIINHDKTRQRKQRTRRLIQNGALAEKYLQCEGMEPAELEKVLKKVLGIVDENDRARGGDRLQRNNGIPK